MVRLELFGVLFITALGSLLHFTFQATGGVWWIGIFSAMDESVWEHLKLAFWPGAVWTLFLWMAPIRRPKNFWLGRTTSLALMPLLIALGFYGYTAALGGHALVLDLTLFVLAIACGQAAAVGVYQAFDLGRGVERAAIGLSLLMLVAFSSLSFLDPDLPLFEEPSDHTTLHNKRSQFAHKVSPER